MKLWIKLTILITIILNLVIKIGIIYLTPEMEKFSVDLVGEKLKSIAASIASNIDGDQYIDLYDSTTVNSMYYQDLVNTIERTKSNLELSDEIYNIFILDNNNLAFEVVTNQFSVLESTLQKLSNPVRKTIKNIYANEHCQYTPMYVDSSGSWLSGLAPIYNSSKEIVGIIKVDQNFNDVLDKMNRIESIIDIGQVYLIPFSILFSLFFSFIFLIPINKVKEQILRVALGDYSDGPKIRSGGEIKELVDASESLRKTIIEQQFKIFNSIEELKKSKNKAEASDNMKSEFLAVLSHEIRTPLNVILGNIEILKLEFDESSTADFMEITSAIKFGSDRLIRTVDMIVLYSELVSGSFDVNIEILKINELFYETIEPYRKLAEEENIVFITDCAIADKSIKVDKFLIMETIKQITDNAIKYSSCCKIKFCVLDKKDGNIVLLIEDNGIGISEKFMHDIFKPFRQENMSYERSYEGNGLGLALAKKSCDTNGFDLIINSEKHKGTIVEIVIPKKKIIIS